MDCSEFVSRVLAADGITDKVEHLNTSGLKALLSKTDRFEHSTSAQVGDIALWDGHTGVVTGVGEEGKVVITHARGTGKLSQESPKAYTPKKYRNSTFHGYYRPINETVDGKVPVNTKANPARPLIYEVEIKNPVTIEAKRKTKPLPQLSTEELSVMTTIEKDKIIRY